MLQTPLEVRLRWRSAAPANNDVRERLLVEVQSLAWSLSEMEALLHEAHRLTGLDHAYTLPRLELRLPLYDLGCHFRIVLTYVDKPRIGLLDDTGRRVADVVLV